MSKTSQRHVQKRSCHLIKHTPSCRGRRNGQEMGLTCIDTGVMSHHGDHGMICHTLDMDSELRYAVATTVYKHRNKSVPRQFRCLSVLFQVKNAVTDSKIPTFCVLLQDMRLECITPRWFT